MANKTDKHNSYKATINYKKKCLVFYVLCLMKLKQCKTKTQLNGHTINIHIFSSIDQLWQLLFLIFAPLFLSLGFYL